MVTAVVTRSAFWSSTANISTWDCSDTRSGAEAPTFTPSTEVIFKPALLMVMLGPVVNSLAATVIFQDSKGKSAVAVVHTMVSVPGINTHLAVREAKLGHLLLREKGYQGPSWR